MIMEKETIDIGIGWVFFYQSEEYLKTGDHSYLLGGNAPLIINKKTGEVTETGTALPIEDYIIEYKREYGAKHSHEDKTPVSLMASDWYDIRSGLFVFPFMIGVMFFLFGFLGVFFTDMLWWKVAAVFVISIISFWLSHKGWNKWMRLLR